MRRVCVLTMVSVLALFLYGCTTVQEGTKFNSLPVGEGTNNPPIAHVNVRISGVYLLGFLPIFCGSVASAGKMAVFTDTVTVDNAVLLLTRTARGMGGVRVYDIVTSIGGANYLLFSFDYVQASGTAVGAPGDYRR